MLIVDEIAWLRDVYMRKWSAVDDRVDGLPFMSSIKPALGVFLVYLAIIFYGPRLMRDRKPLQLNGILFLYNVFVAALSLYMFKEMLVATSGQGYNWLCPSVRHSTHPEELRIVKVMHLYFVSKAIELLDTVFIVARKKNGQLTFLHVYHHSTMFFLFWVIVRWIPGGHAVFAPVINCFVHVVMYSYYALSLLGPKVAKYLWWKRYLTILQLIQFSYGLLVGLNSVFTNCNSVLWLQYFSVFYMISYLFLFGRFYVAAYMAGKRKLR